MTEAAPAPAGLKALGEALARLAASPQTQLGYLRHLGTAESLDELALEFDDAFRPLRPILDRQPAWREALSRLDELDRLLSDTDIPWNSAELERSNSWVRVRQLAAASQRSIELARSGE